MSSPKLQSDHHRLNIFSLLGSCFGKHSNRQRQLAKEGSLRPDHGLNDTENTGESLKPRVKNISKTVRSPVNITELLLIESAECFYRMGTCCDTVERHRLGSDANE